MSMSNDINLATLEVDEDLSMSMPPSVPFVPQFPTYAPTIDWPTFSPTVDHGMWPTYSPTGDILVQQQQDEEEQQDKDLVQNEMNTFEVVNVNDNDDKLHYVGSNACTPTTKCSACLGDCDTDADCLSGLKCFQRDDTTPVPGCAIGGRGDVAVGDYCYDPTVYLFDSTVDEDYVGGILSTADSHLVTEENNVDNLPLVIKLAGGSEEYAYYVGFNDEHVTITKMNKLTDEVSLERLLGANEEYTIENWRNSGYDLEIGVNEMNTETQPLGYAIIYIFMKSADLI